ncbi:NAD-dependent epimerase/dehydratase family protein [Thomasclavelia sp.]|uniref:NAD-dependent epimerase/dehydratase family protein n=1 Tax=Thomasclavelia sp. TaxID=3025757 RepID=UPI0025E50D19|nr:NAD-dependent epimerase/dehydratase family protein [Thomasclavelia sp.]
MKRVLITGANSYIGTSFEKYINEYHPNDYQIDTLDMQDPKWKEYDFSNYDTVFHVAGIAHQKETKENAYLYYKVNRDLAVKTALKAKESKVKQFIFMSSMSVYGLDHSKKLIGIYTPAKPKTNYGKSKLEAEKEILKMADENFIVSIVRPPMVYGENCPGNLTRLFKAVRKFHVFPTIKNERSSITVEKLSEQIEKIISNNKFGMFLPQNEQYMCTYEIVKKQMEDEKVKVLYIPFFNWLIRLLIGKIGLVTKCFGNLRYKKYI